MIDLYDTYRRLARSPGPTSSSPPTTTAPTDTVSEHSHTTPEPARPIRLLATAIPPSATVSTAIHTLHALPQAVDRELPEQLVEIAHRNVADALHRCHRALELDSTDHGYSVDEWLPTVYDIAGQSLESARLETEPPSLVQATRRRSAGCRGPSPTTKAPRKPRPASPKRSPACSSYGRSPAPCYSTDNPSSRLRLTRHLVCDFAQHRNEPVDRDHQTPRS